jgi:hypothetical protein
MGIPVELDVSPNGLLPAKVALTRKAVAGALAMHVHAAFGAPDITGA